MAAAETSAAAWPLAPGPAPFAALPAAALAPSALSTLSCIAASSRTLASAVPEMASSARMEKGSSMLTPILSITAGRHRRNQTNPT